MIEKYEYCSTVPRKFVQDCSSKNVLMNSVDYSSSVTWVPQKNITCTLDKLNENSPTW